MLSGVTSYIAVSAMGDLCTTACAKCVTVWENEWNYKIGTEKRWHVCVFRPVHIATSARQNRHSAWVWVQAIFLLIMLSSSDKNPSLEEDLN